MESFENSVRNSPTTRQILREWLEMYENCCCGQSRAARRLRMALQRITDGRMPLPPHGPPLLARDAGFDEAYTVAFLNQEDTNLSLEVSMPFIQSQYGTPFGRYLTACTDWRNYANRNGMVPEQGPPGSISGWAMRLPSAIFAYVCENCGHQFRALGPVEGYSPTESPPDSQTESSRGGVSRGRVSSRGVSNRGVSRGGGSREGTSRGGTSTRRSPSRGASLGVGPMEGIPPRGTLLPGSSLPGTPVSGNPLGATAPRKSQSGEGTSKEVSHTSAAAGVSSKSGPPPIPPLPTRSKKAESSGTVTGTGRAQETQKGLPAAQAAAAAKPRAAQHGRATRSKQANQAGAGSS